MSRSPLAEPEPLTSLGYKYSPQAFSSITKPSHKLHKPVGSRSPVRKASGRRPRARACRRSPQVVPAAPAPPKLGPLFQSLRSASLVPSDPVGATGAASGRRRPQLRRPPLSVAAREVRSDTVRPPLANLRVRAGAPPSSRSIYPSSSGQDALLAGVFSGEAPPSSVSLSPSLSPD